MFLLFNDSRWELLRFTRSTNMLANPVIRAVGEIHTASIEFDLLRRKYTIVCREGNGAVPRNSALLDRKSGWSRE